MKFLMRLPCVRVGTRIRSRHSACMVASGQFKTRIKRIKTTDYTDCTDKNTITSAQCKELP